jgi:hypothetical protein
MGNGRSVLRFRRHLRALGLLSKVAIVLRISYGRALYDAHEPRMWPMPEGRMELWTATAAHLAAPLDWQWSS